MRDAVQPRNGPAAHRCYPGRDVTREPAP